MNKLFALRVTRRGHLEAGGLEAWRRPSQLTQPTQPKVFTNMFKIIKDWFLEKARHLHALRPEGLGGFFEFFDEAAGAFSGGF